MNKLQPIYRDLLEAYVEAVRLHFSDRLKSVCLFGSIARGEASPESDMDVLVVAEGLAPDIGSRISETNYIHMALKKDEAYLKLKQQGRCGFISDILLTPSEVQKHPPILLDMVDDGLVIFDRDRFLEHVFLAVRRRLRELCAVKVKTGKGWYWILKPDAKPGEIVEI